MQCRKELIWVSVKDIVHTGLIMVGQSRIVLPDGFAAVSAAIVDIPNDILSGICMNSLMFIQYQKAEVDINGICKLLQLAEISMTTQSLQRVINTLCYHYRNAVSKGLSKDAFIQHLDVLKLYSQDKINIIAEVWGIQGNTSQSELREHLNIGQLLDMDWKLSMAISSNSCKNLHAPSITIMIRVQRPDGDIIKKSFELTIEQFQNFSKQLEETKAVLETI